MYIDVRCDRNVMACRTRHSEAAELGQLGCGFEACRETVDALQAENKTLRDSLAANVIDLQRLNEVLSTAHVSNGSALCREYDALLAKNITL